MLKLLVVLLSSFVLFACGDDQNIEKADGASDTAQTATAEKPAASRVRISGDQEFVFEHKIVFGCVDDAMSLTTMTQSPRFQLYLPADIPEGTYPLADFDANRNPQHLRDKAVITISSKMIPGSGSAWGRQYFKNNSGELVIKSKPKSVGEQFIATLDGTLQSKDGREITVDAEFDLPAKGFGVANCQL